MNNDTYSSSSTDTQYRLYVWSGEDIPYYLGFGFGFVIAYCRTLEEAKKRIVSVLFAKHKDLYGIPDNPEDYQEVDRENVQDFASVVAFLDREPVIHESDTVLYMKGGVY